jgi:hypothetical protein
MADKFKNEEEFDDLDGFDDESEDELEEDDELEKEDEEDSDEEEDDELDNLEELKAKGVKTLEDLGETFGGSSSSVKSLQHKLDVDSEDLDDFDDELDDELDEDEESDKPAELSADEYGAEVDLEDEGLSEAEEEEVVADNDFIDEDGEIVVMDKDDDGHGFSFSYVDMDNIAIASARIRKDKSFMSLQKSIRNTGILEPLVVAPLRTSGYYVLIHGYRRFQAGLREGIKVFPCVVNNRIKTSEIPIIEAIYNHTKKYDMAEIKAYIEYLEKDKGIMSSSMIEFLCQLSSGDYAKLKDIWDDNDPDIVEKLMNGAFTITQAFNALEKRRKKETKEQKEIKAAEKAYDTSSETVLEDVGQVGDVGDKDVALTDDEIAEMSIDPTTLDDDLEEKTLDEMVEEGKDMEGFEPHQQDPNNRERIDPAIRKAVMSRDKNTCQCCKRGGPDYVDILDLHHIVEVYLGGKDTVDNGIAVCLNCHHQIHQYAFNQLHIPKSKTPEELETDIKQAIIEENARRKKLDPPLGDMNSSEEDDFRDAKIALYKEEQDKYKRIVKLGNVIREGMQKKGIKLEDAKKEHPIDKIGRQKPGHKNEIA